MDSEPQALDGARPRGI